MKFNSVDDGVYILDNETRILDLDVHSITWDWKNSIPGIPTIHGGGPAILLEIYLNNQGITWDEVWVANSYETWHTFILDRQPIPIKSAFLRGSGFNYGSTNIINVDEPCKILILAEND